MAHPLGGAGNLAALHQNVVPAGGLGIEAQALQRLHHRRGEALHGQLLKLSGIGDEGVIQVAQIVVHGAAAGGPADYVDMMLLHKGTIDLRLSVLILAHHDGVVVLPQQEVLSLQPVGQHIFFKRKIVIRILRMCFQIENLLCLLHFLYSFRHFPEIAGQPPFWAWRRRFAAPPAPCFLSYYNHLLFV